MQGDANECAALYTELMPKGDGRLSAMGTDKYMAANAKSGVNNPSARLMRLIRAMHRAGYPLHTVLAMTAHLERFARSLYVENVTRADVLAASRAEQQQQGDEDVAQLVAAERPDDRDRIETLLLRHTVGAAHDMHVASLAAAYLRRSGQ